MSDPQFPPTDDDAIIHAVTRADPLLSQLLIFEYDTLPPSSRSYGRALSQLLLCWLSPDELVPWDTLRAQGLDIPAILSLHPLLLQHAASAAAMCITPTLPTTPQTTLTDPTCCQPLWTCTLQNTNGTHSKAASIYPCCCPRNFGLSLL